MGEATIQNLTNDAMYQAKQFRKRKQQTRDFINRKNYFPPKHMTINHPRILKKKIQKHVIKTYLDHLCNKTALKMKRNTEIN